MTSDDLPTPEFSRPLDIRQIDGRTVEIEASEAERAALADRFGLVRIDDLRAEVTLTRAGQGAIAQGRIVSAFVQSCAVSGEDLAVAIDEPLHLSFVPATDHPSIDEEIELDPAACDEIEFTGTMLDLGEAAAQSLALAIDPFATGPNADEVRRAAGITDESATGPFAVLAALKKPG